MGGLRPVGPPLKGKEMKEPDYEDIVKAVYRHNIYGNETEVKLSFNTYRNNGTMAVQLFCRPEVFWEDLPVGSEVPFCERYATVTVNLPESESLAANEQFVDSNNLPQIGRWLADNGIAVPTEHLDRSGYCTYQAFAFRVPENIISLVVGAREDAIAQMLVEKLDASSLKPAETNERGDLYNLPSDGNSLKARIIVYKGTSPDILGKKNDIFLLTGSTARDEKMLRFQNLPQDARRDISTQIENALRNSRHRHL